MGMDISDFVDLNRMSTNITHPSGSMSQDGTTRHRASRISNTTDYNMARFRHVEDVCSLADSDSASSRAASPCDTRKRTGTGEGEV